MRINLSRPLFAASLIMFSVITIFLTSCGSTTTNPGINACFDKLPQLYKDFTIANDKLMTKYRKTVDKDEKDKIRASCKGKEARLKKDLLALEKTAHLVGKKIPFKISGILPFKIIGSQIKEITKDHLKFSVSVKTRKKLPATSSGMTPGLNVYFVAIDTDGKEIPHSAGFATTKDKASLSPSTQYETLGLWKAELMEKMETFDYLRIMNETAYNKIKGN